MLNSLTSSVFENINFSEPWQLNCFCPSSNWYQYRTPSQSYGTCIQPVGILSGWSDARVFCKNHWNNSYLASEFTPEKHQFIFDTVQKIPQISEPYAYHIGLRRMDGEWYWDQPSGPILVRNYENWKHNYPSQYDKLSVGMNFENSEKAIRWINVAQNFLSNFVCETAACDTDNYCDASVFEH